MKKNTDLTPKQHILGGIVALSFSIWLFIIPPIGIIVAFVGIIMILGGIATYFESKMKRMRPKSRDK